MASLIKVRNGVAKRNPKRRRKARRNPSVKAKVANPRRRRRRSMRRNGVVTARAVSNPRRKRRYSRRRRNGLLPTGTTKSTAGAVISLGAGMIGTKIGAGIIAPFLGRFMTQVGAGQFTQIGSQLLVSLTVVNFVAKKVTDSEKAKYAVLGGLAVTALDALDLILPDSLNLNPFSMSQPVLIAPAPAVAVAPSVSGGGIPVY